MVRNFLLMAGASILLLSACENKDSGESTANTDSTASTEVNVQERNKKIVMESFDAMAKGDVDGMFKNAAPDAVDYGEGSMPPMKNQDSIKNIIKGFMAAFPDYKIIGPEFYADGNKVLVYYECTGTWKGDMMGMKATGKSFKSRDVEIFTFNDEGKVTEHRSVQNMNGMFAQLGAAAPPEAPKK